MRNVYINGLASVSTQKDCRGFLNNDLVKISKSVNESIQPSYKDIISATLIRRMAKGVKMGLYSSLQSLKEANETNPGAIIIGTGKGCLIDSSKFLRSMIDNQENYLTPTSFIQSTYNTVGSQISLHLKCRAYNFTYVNRRVSYESALMDGFLQIKGNEINTALVGAVDEIESYSTKQLQLIEQVNIDMQRPFHKGINLSEGASFFVLSNKKTESSYAELIDITIQNQVDENEITQFIDNFLEQNKILSTEIDVIVLGTNGSGNDLEYYSLLKKHFPNATNVEYKDYIGEYDTSSAFGFLLANEILKEQIIPEQLNKNKVDKKEYKNIIIYNQFDSFDHSAILLSKC